MDEFPEVDVKDGVDDLISHIKMCDHVIKVTQAEKQKSEAKLREIFDHKIDGAATYDHGNYKVTITAGLNYKFNKKKYLELLNAPEKIDPKFQIVKQVTEYQLNKKAIRELDYFGSPQDKYLKSLFVTTSEKKLHVAIKEVKNESIASDIGSVDDDGVFTPRASKN